MFTVPESGQWRVSFSMRSEVKTDQSNTVNILYNQKKLPESSFQTKSEYYNEITTTTGGRELVLRAEQEDTLVLQAFTVDNNLYDIITCFEFLFPL